VGSNNPKPNKQKASVKLLTEYRAVLWQKSAFEAVSGNESKFLLDCLERINQTQKIVECLKNHKRLGDKMYWIIYATFMTEKQPIDMYEILSIIADKYEAIPRRTYFRLKKCALEMLDAQLSDVPP